MKKVDFGDKLTKTGEFINENKKPLLYLGGAIAVVIVGYAIVHKLSGGISNLFTDKAKRGAAFQDVEVDETKTTISDSIANSYANQLYNAMESSGTDENTIYAVFKKLQNPNDFKKVYNKFGKKSYSGIITGGSPYGVETWLGMYVDGDLIEWLKTEISVLNYPTYSLIKKTIENAGFAY